LKRYPERGGRPRGGPKVDAADPIAEWEAATGEEYVPETPSPQLVLSYASVEERDEFIAAHGIIEHKRTGLRVSAPWATTPERRPLVREERARMIPRYPIFIPSRDRYQPGRRLTIRALTKDDIPFRVVVEPHEVDAYAKVVGDDRVLVLPENDRGLTYARNWIRDLAESEGHAKHHQLDDNIREFRTLVKGSGSPATPVSLCADARTSRTGTRTWESPD
jgi:hypothetical protein